MHLEAHIDTVFAWRPLRVVDADNCSRGRKVWWRRVWRNRCLWVGDTPALFPRGKLTNGVILADTICHKDLSSDPRIPGTAIVVSCRPMHPDITLGEDNSWTSWT
jgi:hypothetical protein